MIKEGEWLSHPKERKHIMLFSKPFSDSDRGEGKKIQRESWSSVISPARFPSSPLQPRSAQANVRDRWPGLNMAKR